MNEITADTEEVAKPTSEETNVDDSLESALSEYDQATTPDTPAPMQGQDDTKLVVDYVKNKMVEDAKVEVQSSLDNAIKIMKESSELNIPDKALLGYLHVLADEQPRFRQAYMDRQSNPQGWASAVRAAGKELSKASSPVDHNTTEDMVAVTESLTRGSKTELPNTDKAPSKADFDRMSDQEFREWESKNMQRA